MGLFLAYKPKFYIGDDGVIHFEKVSVVLPQDEFRQWERQAALANKEASFVKAEQDILRNREIDMDASTLERVARYAHNQKVFEELVDDLMFLYDDDLRCEALQRGLEGNYTQGFDFNAVAGKKEKEIEKSGCFIATACYGDYDAPEVLALRRYRDDTLVRTFLGRLFVKTYYAFSPPVAGYISTRPRLRAFVRKCLIAPIVKSCNA